MAPLQLTLSASDDPVLADGPTVERRWLDATSWVDVVRGYLVGADTLFAELRDAVAWTQGRRIMFDAMVDDPRLSRWFRRDDDPHPTLTVVRADLERRYRRRLGGVGLNYYRDGHDSVAPHRDRELRRLDDTLVAILTLGAKRPFLVRPHGGGPSVDVHPASGDLLVMGGACQRDWEHGVPKRRSSGPRISASWRWSART